MNKSRRVRMAGILSAVALMLGTSVAFSGDALAYAPGTAAVSKPTYDVNAGGFKYHCSFAHWRSGAKVTWSCNLYIRYFNELGFLQYDLVQPHSGSWTPGSTSYTTPTYLKLLGIQASYCAQAHALSVDGGVTSSYACY